MFCLIQFLKQNLPNPAFSHDKHRTMLKQLTDKVLLSARYFNLKRLRNEKFILQIILNILDSHQIWMLELLPLINENHTFRVDQAEAVDSPQTNLEAVLCVRRFVD